MTYATLAYGLIMAASFLAPVSLAAAELDEQIETLSARADEGDAEAQYRLGLYYQYSQALLKGCQPDYWIAGDLYLKAARSGHVRAMTKLGFLYEFGLGVPDSDKAAFEMYSTAAETGQPEAMGRLAVMYKDYPAFQDEQKAFDWSVRAAERGNKDGLNILGVFYNKGVHYDQDYSKAMEYYRKAADAGSCLALMNIGGLYFNGDGVPQDADQAQSWFQRAKDCDNPDERTDWVIDRAELYLNKSKDGRLAGMPTGVGQTNSPQEATQRQAFGMLGILGVLMLATAEEEGSDWERVQEEVYQQEMDQLQLQNHNAYMNDLAQTMFFD